MFKLSKKADYGLIAVKHLAMHRQQHACSANEIAEEYGISATLMAKGLQKLAHRFLVVAKHGSSGGFKLAQGPPPIRAPGGTAPVSGPLLCTYLQTPPARCEAPRPGFPPHPL